MIPASAAPQGASTVSAAQNIGLPFFGVWMPRFDSGAVSRAAASSAGLASVEIWWSALEPSTPGTWNESVRADYDSHFATLAQNGIKPIAVVGWAPSWAAASTRGPVDASKWPHYLDFMSRLVQRYSAPPYNVHHWMLWPEPDAGQSAMARDFSGGDRRAWGDSGSSLAALLTQARPVIKDVDPGATIILGPLAHDWFDDPAGTSPGFNRGGIFKYRFLDDFLQAGGGSAVDVIGINAYLAFAIGWEAAQRQGVDVAAKIGHVKARMKSRGVDRPILIGEGGFWSSSTDQPMIPLSDGNANEVGKLVASPQNQADYVGKFFARARSGGAAAAIWFTHEDIDPATKYGLFDEAGNAKPAATAYRHAASMLGDADRATMPGWFSVVGGNVERYGFASSTQLTVVAWATGSVSPSAQVSVVAGTQVLDRDGNAVSPVGTSNGRSVYSLTSSPVYFTRSNFASYVPVVSRLGTGLR